MNLLIDALDLACPGFVPDIYEVDLQYSWISGFVRHVIGARLAGRQTEVQAVFAIVEQTIAENGPHSEVAIIGFLESMQNEALHSEGSQPVDFVAYLGPNSAHRWDQLNGFWQAVRHSKPNA